MNECALNRDTCLEGQVCENTIGSYVCRRNVNCGTGYTLDRQTQQCVGKLHWNYSPPHFELTEQKSSTWYYNESSGLHLRILLWKSWDIPVSTGHRCHFSTVQIILSFEIYLHVTKVILYLILHWNLFDNALWFTYLHRPLIVKFWCQVFWIFNHRYWWMSARNARLWSLQGMQEHSWVLPLCPKRVSHWIQAQPPYWSVWSGQLPKRLPCWPSWKLRWWVCSAWIDHSTSVVQYDFSLLLLGHKLYS